jgi:hypothetical protein
MSHHSVQLLIAVWALAGGVVAAGTQTRPAAFYALPADGAWVEYAWTATEPGGKKQTGTLRISSVGTRTVQGVRCRWIELKRQTWQGDRLGVRWRKLLVAEDAFRQKKTQQTYVIEGFAREKAGGPVTRLGRLRIGGLLHLGIEGADVSLQAAPAREKVTAGGAALWARHVSAAGTSGSRRLRYDGWLTDEVPFGWAKVEIREEDGKRPARVIYTAIVARQGKGARSEVDESRSR